MSPRRPDYPSYVESLGFDKNDKPDVFEMLSVSLSKRVTDLFEFFPKLNKLDGKVSCRFFCKVLIILLE